MNLFNRYMSEDREAFEDLYRPVEQEEERPVQAEIREPEPEPDAREAMARKPATRHAPKKKGGGLGLDLRGLLKGFKLDDIGLVPLLILLFLILDVDDDEKLIILALAFAMGI